MTHCIQSLIQSVAVDDCAQLQLIFKFMYESTAIVVCLPRIRAQKAVTKTAECLRSLTTASRVARPTNGKLQIKNERAPNLFTSHCVWRRPFTVGCEVLQLHSHSSLAAAVVLTVLLGL